MAHDEITSILKRLSIQMEQAETIEDCLILIDNALDEQAPNPIRIKSPDNDELTMDIPPGTFVGAGLERNDGGFVERRFAPIAVGAGDTLEVTWRISGM